MKEKRILLLAILLSAIAGWALGFLRLPYIERNDSFFIGFLAGLAFFALILLFVFIWNKNARLIRLIGKDTVPESPSAALRTHRILWIGVALFIAGGGLLSSYGIFRQSEFSRQQARQLELRLRQQSALIESARKSQMAGLMNQLFDQVDAELRRNPQRQLSEETIGRIALLHRSFQPYYPPEGDSLTTRMRSPERGQLLLLLAAMNIDSASLSKIKFKTSFAAADLRSADLKGADLRHADLQGADLRDADLRAARLDGADLRKANLWGAKLSKATLREADLKRAILSWADLNEADLTAADLDGVEMKNAGLKKAALSKAHIRWADLSGTRLEGADLSEAEMRATNLSRANLKGADLSGANLMRVVFTEAQLSGVSLSKTAVEKEDWLQKLDVWRVGGAKAIQQNYTLTKDQSGRTKFQLEKLER